MIIHYYTQKTKEHKIWTKDKIEPQHIHDGSNYTWLDKLLQEYIHGFLSGKYPKCNALLHPI